MDNNEQKSANQEYTIKIIPEQGDTIHSIRLPLWLIKYGIGSLIAGSLLFVGAFGYAAYSTLVTHQNTAEMQELREVNNIQQEQLLQLSKKANSLQDALEQLSQQEEELRRISGTPADSAEHTGQGGPYPTVQAEFGSITASLQTLEKGLAERQENLQQIREDIKLQREQLATIMPAMTGGSYGAAATIPSIWPARGEVSSPFGLRWNGSDFHPGIDIANDMGTPIVATADGVVTYAGWNAGGYGNMVDIDHGNGITTRYGHAQQVVVTAGQQVKRGQLIAYMGSTGFSTGPHVHYEVSVNGQRVNPVSYL